MALGLLVVHIHKVQQHGMQVAPHHRATFPPGAIQFGFFTLGAQCRHNASGECCRRGCCRAAGMLRVACLCVSVVRRVMDVLWRERCALPAVLTGFGDCPRVFVVHTRTRMVDSAVDFSPPGHSKSAHQLMRKNNQGWCVILESGNAPHHLRLGFPLSRIPVGCKSHRVFSSVLLCAGEGSDTFGRVQEEHQRRAHSTPQHARRWMRAGG